jgi:hypothetical protein
MPQQVGDSGPSNVQATHMQLANGIEPNNLTAQQIQNNMPGGATAQQQRVGAYQANLAQQQQSQMPNKGPMPNAAGPQNQGSPMNGAAANGNGFEIYYDPSNRATQPGAPPGGPGGNHALQDYQMQLMLLEQQNKKRLMMARQEQDSMTVPRGDGPPGPGVGQMPNGQQFQGTSPQGPRSIASPNPADQMKRGNPQMAGGMPSPLPDGQSRGSPSGGMNFNMPGAQMDPNMNPQFFQKMGGMDPNMIGAGMPNNMRPPSSHPGPNFPNATPQQVAMARAQAQQQQAAQQGGWQGPNGQMVQQPQGPPQQAMGTPQQRAMPPPSAPTAGAPANGRTQPSSPQQGAAPPTPQQGNKAITKKKPEAKDNKTKVYFCCVNGYYCRNVDIDDSALQRRDLLRTSMLVPHPLPKPTPPGLRRLPRLPSPQAISKVQTVLPSCPLTASLPLKQAMWLLKRTICSSILIWISTNFLE